MSSTVGLDCMAASGRRLRPLPACLFFISILMPETMLGDTVMPCSPSLRLISVGLASRPILSNASRIFWDLLIFRFVLGTVRSSFGDRGNRLSLVYTTTITPARSYAGSPRTKEKVVRLYGFRKKEGQ